MQKPNRHYLSIQPQISPELQETVMQIRQPLGPTTAPRLAWMIASHLPIPGVRGLMRVLGVFGPIFRFGFAVADIWIALDTSKKAQQDPKLENLYSATTSTLLAACSVIAAMNLPLISRLSAVMTVMLDFTKRSALSLAEAEIQPIEPGIVNPSASGLLLITPEPVAVHFPEPVAA